MKRISLLCYCCTIVTISFTQSFPGYTTSNYSGVNGVFANPANVVSRYNWNVNLTSLHAGIANNNASFNLSNLTSTFDNNLNDQLFGNTSKNTNGAVNVDIHGLSFMFNTGKKNSFAFTSRLRVLANIADLDGQFIKSINDELSSSSFPITLQSNENQKIAVNGWMDYGLTYGRVLVDKGAQYLKAGVTAKYLAGATNNYASINNLHGTLNENLAGDVYMTNGSGRVALGIGGIDFTNNNIDVADAIKFKSSGFGADLGLIYEYRPANTSSYPGKYKFKAGIALLDIGSISYKPDPTQSGDYTMNIPNGSQWFPADLDGKSISEIKDYLDSSPYFTKNGTTANSYKAGLPTTLQVTVDYALNKVFYLNISGQANLVKNKSIYNSFYYSTFVFTPRYENKIFGAYLPISYNDVSGLNAGLSIRVGPVFFGSGAVVNALIDKSKQADFFLGIQFGGIQKK